MGVKHSIPQPAIDRSRKLKAGERKAQAQGVGPSKLHGGGGQTPDMSHCTVNGETLPENCWDTFPYSLTDQGKAAAAKELKELPISRSRDRSSYDDVGSEDRKLDKFRDDLAGNNGELQRVADPMEALMRRHTPQGHRGLFMSAKKCADSGMIRGILEYKPVLIQDPEDPARRIRVECGGMFLASVPEHLAQEADRHYAAINRSKQVAAVEKVRESADQIMAEGRLEDMARRRRLLDDISGETLDDPESADRELLAHETA